RRQRHATNDIFQIALFEHEDVVSALPGLPNLKNGVCIGISGYSVHRDHDARSCLGGDCLKLVDQNRNFARSNFFGPVLALDNQRSTSDTPKSSLQIASDDDVELFRAEACVSLD